MIVVNKSFPCMKLVVVTVGLVQIAAHSVMREYKNKAGAFNVQGIHEGTCFMCLNFFL